MLFSPKIDSKKGVIFDFDDTIANTKLAKSKGLRTVSFKIHDFLKKRGITHSFKRLRKEVANTAQKMVGKGADDRNLWWMLIIKKYSDESPSKKFLDMLTKKYWKKVLEKGVLYKDVSSVLDYLKNKGYRLGLLTDSDGLKGFKSKRISSFNLKKWFTVAVVAGEDTKEIKPHKDSFSLILKKINLKPKQCVFVGNDPRRDIFGAKKAGMKTVLIKRDDCRIANKPDWTIKNLSELKKILA